MTVIVTRDVAPRFRGFLASCMLEIGPGVYTAPRMTSAVRERVWTVLEEWFTELGGTSIVMTCRDSSMPGGQRIDVLGSPPCELYEHNGIYLAHRCPDHVSCEPGGAHSNTPEDSTAPETT